MLSNTAYQNNALISAPKMLSIYRYQTKAVWNGHNDDFDRVKHLKHLPHHGKVVRYQVAAQLHIELTEDQLYLI